MPDQLIGRLRDILLKCGPFDSDSHLRFVFIESRLSIWAAALPEADNRQSRIDGIIYYLHDKHNEAQENALVLFLLVLSEQVDPGDLCKQQLAKLAREVAANLHVFIGFQPNVSQAVNEYKILANAVDEYKNDLRKRLQASGENGADYYKGLQAFSVQDTNLFYGREQAIEAMMALLTDEPESRLIILHAKSGIGKTSFIQAGLIPRTLEGDDLPIYVRRSWRKSPILALKQCLLPAVGQTPGLMEASLCSFLKKVKESQQPTTNFIVFWDQFEDFFDEEMEADDRQQFLDQLADCLEETNLPVRFVISIRDESFGQISHFDPPIVRPFNNEFLLPALTNDQARDAIEGPIRKRKNGIRFEDGLVDTLLQDFQTTAIEPAQLQLVCLTLIKQLGAENKVITEKLYQNSGRVAGILLGYLDQVIRRDLPAEQRQTAKFVLISLVTLTGQNDRKNREVLQQLYRYEYGNDGKLLDKVLDNLQRGLLIRQVWLGDMEEEEGFELVHDYLIPEIQSWIGENRKEARRISEMLIHGQTQYEEYGRVLNHDQLQDVQAQLVNHHLQLDEKNKHFLLVSAVDRKVDIVPWLTLSGEPAMGWLRKLQQGILQYQSEDEVLQPGEGTTEKGNEFLEQVKERVFALRSAALIMLSQLNDETTFNTLQSAALSPVEGVKRQAVQDLALFIHNSPGPRPYDKRLRRSLEINLARLQLRDYKTDIIDLSRSSAKLGVISTLLSTIAFSSSLEDVPFIRALLGFLFFALLFSAAMYLLMYVWGGSMVSGQAILDKKPLWLQLTSLAILGSLVGFFTFFPFALDMYYGWAAGAVIGFIMPLVYAFSPRFNRLVQTGVPILVALVVLVVCLMASYRNFMNQDRPELSIPGLVATGVFAGLFIRLIIKNKRQDQKIASVDGAFVSFN